MGVIKKIIDIYNSYDGPLPRGLKMLYSWSWCACTWSALAIKLGYTEIMPIEMSCSELIRISKSMGIWIEDDAHVPLLGEAVLYDWQDDGVGDNRGAPDHIGVVVYVDEKLGTFKVVEGNYSNSVKVRNMKIDGRYIRGFISPKYDEEDAYFNVDKVVQEVIDGKWGSGSIREKKLTEAGYNYREIQNRVNFILKDKKNETIPSSNMIKASGYASSHDSSLSGTYKTTDKLNLRDKASTTSKVLTVIPKEKTVQCYGYYSNSVSYRWYYVQFNDGKTIYTGFVASKYLRRV